MCREEKLGAYATKRVAAWAHLPTSWLFEPAKRPDDRADYCLGLKGFDANGRLRFLVQAAGIEFRRK